MQRVMVVDDHPLFRSGIARVLREADDLYVCAEAGDYLQALEAARRHKPDLALVDISMPGINGIELMKCLRAEHPNLRMLALSMHDESVYALRAIRAGAAGFVGKDAAHEELLAAIDSALDGHLILSDQLSRRLLDIAIHRLDPDRHPQFESLSPREVEVLRLYGAGLETAEICDRLKIGTKTVETYRTRIKEKLGLADFSELRRFAVEWTAMAGDSSLASHVPAAPGKTRTGEA